jgi:hypothetical protein
MAARGSSDAHDLREPQVDLIEPLAEHRSRRDEVECLIGGVEAAGVYKETSQNCA